MGGRVGYRESASEEFGALPRGVQRALRDTLSRIDPKAPDAHADLDVARIRGTSTLWRLALNDYRCVFRAERDRIVVFAVGLRPGFYQRFER